MPSTLLNRSFTFGIGTRDFNSPISNTELEERSPGPTAYFNKLKYAEKKYGFGNFGLAKEKLKNVIERNHPSFTYSPGPSRYSYSNLSIGKDSKKITIKPRIEIRKYD